MFLVFAVEWREYQKVWGSKPDCITWHKTIKGALDSIEKQRALSKPKDSDVFYDAGNPIPKYVGKEFYDLIT